MGADTHQFNGEVRGPGKSSWRRRRRFLKRQTARLARRLGKKLLDDAPRRVTRGEGY